MKHLFERFLNDVRDICKDIDPHDERLKKLCENYGKLADIHIRNSCDYGTAFTNEDFACLIEKGFITVYDGTGFYVDTRLMETDHFIDFDANAIRARASTYPYILWYNK